ncbi:hypothetical protein HDV05_006438 [Chytridiales sp. JEL 0842]|nr:hypothetical protein HDV05_006438 [Chytridiales sp. JEL 0842]
MQARFVSKRAVSYSRQVTHATWARCPSATALLNQRRMNQAVTLSSSTSIPSPSSSSSSSSTPHSHQPQKPSPSPPSSSWSPDVVRPYRDKSTFDLLNSYAVFKLCGVKPLVDYSEEIFEIADKLRVTPLVHGVVKNTFFRHFCGGENIKEVLPTMAAFQKRGIGSILDLAMEADIDAASLTGQAAREQAAKISTMMKESVDIASESPNSFIAAKVTAFVPPAILLRWSNTLRSLKSAFDKADKNHDGMISLEEFTSGPFQAAFPRLQDKAFATKIFQEIARINGNGSANTADWIAVSEAFSISNTKTRAALYVPPNTTAAKTEAEKPEYADELLPITESDFETADLVNAELDSLCAYAKQKKVKIMIDAEQTYFQPAIDDVALFLSKKFNSVDKFGPTVFNTYQMYLKDALGRMKIDLDRAKRYNYSFGVKIVRGAYMVSERERAEEMSYADPINSTLEDTHKCYNSAIETLLNSIAESRSTAADPKKVQFVVASHNKDSVALAVKMMNERGIEGKNGDVAFAQLMGMQDGTSFALAANGFKAYKYIPYGPINVTIPYLLRRAQENSAVLGGVAEDKKNLYAEIQRRFGGSKPASTVSA